MRPFRVGIAGGTASGKTTLAARAAARLGATVLAHDRYYRDAPDPRHHDFDHPDALDTARLVDHLATLRSGSAIKAPIYDFKRHARAPEFERIEPTPIVVVEGILVLAEPALRLAFDYTVYVHADDDVRLERRLRRDTTERGRTWEDILRQWFHTVRPAHRRWVAPSRGLAHLVLDGEADPEEEVARLVNSVTLAIRLRLPESP